MLNEGKKEYLAKYAERPEVKATVEKFWKIRHRISAPENDIDWWIKKPFDDLKDFVDNFDSRKRSVRRSDVHAENAKKYGAILMDTIDRYEIWYVPSYEAAVELGRFYKNISTNWCISTDEPKYFNSQYSDSEFMFLIHEDPESCSDKDLTKLALQVSKEYESKDDYNLWDVSDDDISQESEYIESDLFDTVGKVMELWDKIPYNRDQYEEKAVMTYATDAAWLKDHVFQGCEDFQMANDGSVSAVFGMDALAEALSDGRDCVSTKMVKTILDGDGQLYDWDGDVSYDLSRKTTAEFDEQMKPYGLNWNKVVKIVQSGEADGVDEKTERAVSELMDDDFCDGNGYSVIYADCMSSGAEMEAREDIMKQLEQLGVQSVNYDKKYLAFNCRFSANAVLKMTKIYRMRNLDLNAFQLMAYDEDYDADTICIEAPYYGWSGFDDDMMKDALQHFAKNLIREITKVKDLPGQTYFDFDKDYINN